MTVPYSNEMAQKRIANFGRMLFRWRGSIYKLLWKELLIYGIMYIFLFLIYTYILKDFERKTFERIFHYVHNLIDEKYVHALTFILAFYVSMIVNRWWKICSLLPWPDNVVLRMVVYIPGVDAESRLARRTLARWMNLSAALALRSISAAIRKRFPTLEYIQELGLIHENEMQELNRHPSPSHHYWVPLIWCKGLISQLRQSGLIQSDRFQIEIIDELEKYRRCLADLLNYDWVSVPLVYTQVVTLGVYAYFLGSLFAQQAIVETSNNPHHFFKPFIQSMMEFVFYMGWLKVAETLINPLGEDDDDFELNWLLDRNHKYTLLVLDSTFGQYPALVKDVYMDKLDMSLPYTAAALGVKDIGPVPSQSGQ